jgi:epoxyqueuosine reductase QueG
MYWRQASLYYRHLDLAASQLAAMIEGEGDLAAPVPGCFPFDLKARGDFWGALSLVRMAEAAGLGRVGVSGLLMHPRFGPRLHLGGLVTTLDLPLVSRGGSTAPACPEGCRACREACPAQALDGRGGVDRLACVRKSSSTPLFNWFMRQGGFPQAQAELLVHLTAVDDHQMYTCLACVADCPRL